MTPYITIAIIEGPLGNEKLCSCTKAHGTSGRNRLKCSFITSFKATPPSAAAATSTASSLRLCYHINPAARVTIGVRRKGDPLQLSPLITSVNIGRVNPCTQL